MKGSFSRGLVLDPGRESLVSSSGGLLLQRTIRLAGLDRALSAGLARWRGARAVHDPGKVLLDLATAVALGGDCAADLAVGAGPPAAVLDAHGRGLHNRSDHSIRTVRSPPQPTT